MTNGELIEKLKKFDLNEKVLIELDGEYFSNVLDVYSNTTKEAVRGVFLERD